MWWSAFIWRQRLFTEVPSVRERSVMAINAPVQATIIHPGAVPGLVTNHHYNWVWGERKEVSPPSLDEIWESAMSAFSANPSTVTFMVSVTAAGSKFIDFIDAVVTGVKYESGAQGMLLIELSTEDNRWIKVSGFYDCRPGNPRSSGWLTLTPRR